MMFTINRRNVTRIDGQLTAEASDIGLAPGRFPTFVRVVNDNGTGIRFQREGADITTDGELLAVRYVTTGRTQHLTVFND